MGPSSLLVRVLVRFSPMVRLIAGHAFTSVKGRKGCFVFRDYLVAGYVGVTPFYIRSTYRSGALFSGVPRVFDEGEGVGVSPFCSQGEFGEGVQVVLCR